MNNSKRNKIFSFIDFLLKKVIPYCLVSIFTFVIIVALFKVNFGINSILGVLDIYFKLILSSWPGAILVFGVLVLWMHHDAIDHFIKNRMTGIGPDGVKGDVLTSSASDVELKAKTILDTKKMDEQVEKINLKAQAKKPGVDLSIEKTDPKLTPNVLSEKNQQRYQKVLEVENIVQTSLIEKYGDNYKPQVKLSSPGRNDIIVDGVLFSHKKIAAAIEIKYVSSKSYDALRFMIARMKTKLAIRGITRLIVIVVGDNLLSEDAQKIKEMNLNLAKMFFYNRKETGDLEEILLSNSEKFS